MIKLSRKIVVPGSFFLFIVVCSVIIAGWERWEISSLLQNKGETSDFIQHYKSKIENEENTQESLYNLAYVYYQQNQFDEAVKELREAQVKGALDSEFEKKILFNLGNSLFRLSEEKEDLKEAVQLMKQSLEAYRNILEIEKNAHQFGIDKNISDEDLIHNFTLARTRLKILLDELKQEAQRKQAQKTIYQLIQEIKNDEKRVAEMTKKLVSNPPLKEASVIGQEILALRSQLPEKVEILKNKIEELTAKQNQQQLPPAMPLKQPGSGTI